MNVRVTDDLFERTRNGAHAVHSTVQAFVTEAIERHLAWQAKHSSVPTARTALGSLKLVKPAMNGVRK